LNGQTAHVNKCMGSKGISSDGHVWA